MTKDNNFKEYIYPVVILTVIALVTTLLLAITNSVSAPIIERNANAEAVAARQELLPEADNFEDVSEQGLATSPDGSAYCVDAFKATNGAGYVMTVKTSSFGGELTMMVGIDGSGAIEGVKVTAHSDTPGVGTKDQDPEYLAQYNGKTALSSDDVKKESDFQFISGASVSGSAIHKGVAAALAEYALLGGA